MPISTVTSESQIPEFGTGTYINRSPPMSVARGRGNLVVGIICAFPWGAAEEWVTPDSDTDLLESFIPFGWGGDDAEEMLGLPWGPIRVWNVRGSGNAAATRTFDDANAGDSLTITAKKTGSAGNRILITITANVTTSTSRDVRVYVLDPDGGVMWDETYLAVQTSNGTVTDPGDPWVTMAKASGATLPAAAISAAALSGGSAGTLAATDYRQAMDAAGPDAGVDILVCVGPDTSLVADVRATMTTWAASSIAESVICAVLPTPAAESVSTAITNVASYRHRKLRAIYPRVQRRYTYSYRGYSRTATATMDGGPVLACIIQRSGPTRSAFMQSVLEISDDAVLGILDLEAGYGGISNGSQNSLMAAGINGWWKNRKAGRFVPLHGVTTYLDSSARPARDLDERFFAYVSQAVSEVLEGISGLPLDVDLASRRLGPVTDGAITAIRAFMEDLLRQNLIVAGFNPDGTPSPAYAIDPYTLATSTELGNNRWDLGLSYRQTPTAERVVLRINAGTLVTITR